MKILFLTNGIPPHRWAGTETYTAGIAEEFQKRGHKIQVLCVGDWEAGAQGFNGFTDDAFHSIAVRRLKLNWAKTPDPFSYLYNNPTIASYLSSYLQELKPDLVHVTSCETLSASILQAVKAAGVPLVLTLTDFWFLCPRINLLRSDGTLCDGMTSSWQCLQCQLLHSRAYHWATSWLPPKLVPPLLMGMSKYPLITRQAGLRGMAGDMQKRKQYLSQAITWPEVRITASSFVRNIFLTNNIRAPIDILPYGHDLSWLNAEVEKTSSEFLRIGFIGQITHFKGVHLLIEAINLLNQADREKIVLSIFGDVKHSIDYANRLYALAGDRKNIKFCGTYPHDQSAEIFCQLDVLVVPSIWYDFPLVIHEAFATKTPVVATNLGEMAEVIKHGENGLLFERGNANALMQQLKRFIVEPQLLNKLKLGISPVLQIADHVDQLESMYHDLTQHKGEAIN
jgi:glycosyltransferase involved in cell wall biosynthesis